jgi:hypothetical protein
MKTLLTHRIVAKEVRKAQSKDSISREEGTLLFEIFNSLCVDTKVVF